jgi:tetratricopeptide (TPR) repeat protein
MNDSDETKQSAAVPAVDPADQLELKLPDESAAPRDLALWAGVLMLLVLVAYWPATSGRFLWGDRHLVVDNLWVRYPGGLADGWAQRWKQPERYPFAIYQPITASAYWLEYRLGGHVEPTGPSRFPPEPTPMAFHLANLIFHAAAAALLWLVLRELMMPGAWVIAAIFALHPLNTEAVSWILDQDWPLGGLLFFGSAYLYLQFVKHREKDRTDREAGGPGVDPVLIWGLYSGAAAACLAALLANPATAPLPLALLLVLWWRKRLLTQDYVLLLPLLVIAVIFWLTTGDLRAQGTASLWHRGWEAQLAAIGSGLFCCMRVVLPISLKVFHSQWAADQWWLGAFALACWIGVTGFLWLGRGRWGRGLVAASVIFGLLEICSLNWFDPFRRASFTDAGTYLAGVPVIAVVVVLVIDLLKNAAAPATFTKMAMVVSAVFMLLLGGVSWARAHVFDNPVSFWQDAATKNPQSSVALGQLAEELRLRAINEGAQGDSDSFSSDLGASLDNAQQAVTANPENGDAERTWANILVVRGDVKAALPHFQKAVNIEPGNFELLSEYGSAMDTIAMFKEAIPQIDAALRIDPLSALAHRLLGIAYGGLGNETRAISELEFSLRLEPSNPATLQALGEQDAKAGHLDDAMNNYTLSMQLDPASQLRPDLYIAGAKIRERQYRWAEAVDWYKLALKLSPENAEVKMAIETDTIKAKAQAATRPTTGPTTKPAM